MPGTEQQSNKVPNNHRITTVLSPKLLDQHLRIDSFECIKNLVINIFAEMQQSKLQTEFSPKALA